MKKKGICLGALLLTAVMGLTACGGGETSVEYNEFDAEAYVDGLIKNNYLGQYDPDYLEAVGLTEEQAQLVYEDSIQAEVHFFLNNLYRIEYPTDKYEEEVGDLYREIYSHTKYDIVSATQQEDGSFSVKVNVEPINIVQLVDGDWDKSMEDFYEKYPSADVNKMNDEQYEKYDNAWARQVMKLYEEKMPEIGNMTERSVVVEVEKNDEGYYGITTESFQALDDLIIDYTNGIGREEGEAS